jgi:NTP pyrophosphatase (non-canonical NTP hydrolase)
MATPPTDRLSVVLAELRQFVRDRDWEQFHDPKNLAMAVASEAGELLAEYRWVANSEADRHSMADGSRQRIAQEVADVAIALILLADRIGMDLIDVMKDKIVMNSQKYPSEKSRGQPEAPRLQLPDPR